MRSNSFYICFLGDLPEPSGNDGEKKHRLLNGVRRGGGGETETETERERERDSRDTSS